MEQQTSSVVQQILLSSQQTHLHPTQESQAVHGGTESKPRPKFDPAEDVDALDKAMTSKDVKEGTIIDILTKRTNEQRQEIKAAYQKKNGKPLDEVLNKTLSGQLRDMILALLRALVHDDADILRTAIKGMGTDEDALIEVCVSRSNQQIKQIHTVYKEEYKTELEKDIIADTSGDFQKSLLALLKGERSEDVYVNEDLADEDAKALYEAGEKNKKTDLPVFIRILTSCSFPHLRKVFERYATYSKHDINQALDLQLKGDIESCLVAIVKCATNMPGFFAEKLHLAMKGTVTNYKVLTRIMVSRSENDMKHIKAQYKQLYGKSLREALMEGTKGDCQTVLVALCGYDDPAPI
ncbi:annexin A1-like [Spea bombifrons]|uniref:annexin A1-like n=1 Tax=Spea bombifrons TaxID=233779 RepID=UPI002349F3A6|nr:annexin A1-like [Spea bombifrons]